MSLFDYAWLVLTGMMLFSFLAITIVPLVVTMLIIKLLELTKKYNEVNTSSNRET